MIPQEVLDEFRKDYDEGNWEEEYLVLFIKKYLRTPEQKALLDARDISIEDVLNGRIEGADQDGIYNMLFEDWNAKLGFRGFGF